MHLWSTDTHQPRLSQSIEDSAHYTGFHPSGTVMAVGTVIGIWMLLDMEMRALVYIPTDCNEQISVFGFSPDRVYLALGSHNNLVYVN